MSVGMAEIAEMDAKDILDLFREIKDQIDGPVSFEEEDPTTFGEVELETQLGWFAHQIDLRIGERTPSADLLALMAALGGFLRKGKLEDGIDQAYQLWQIADKKIKSKKLASLDMIKDYLSQVGLPFRTAPWPRNRDGASRKNLDLIPFLRLCIPNGGQDALEARFREYLRDNPIGKKQRTSTQVEKELLAVKERRFVEADLFKEGGNIIEWWMNQEAFDPLSFPKDSYGDMAKRALGLAEPEKGEKSSEQDSKNKGDSAK